MRKNVLPHFLLSFRAFLNSVFPEWCIRWGGPVAWRSCSTDLNVRLFILVYIYEDYYLCYRRQWRPPFEATHSRWISDVSCNTRGSPACRTATLQTCNCCIEAWDGRRTRPWLGDHACVLTVLRCTCVHLLKFVSASSVYFGGKTIPLQAWTGPVGSRRLRLPDIKTVGT